MKIHDHKPLGQHSLLKLSDGQWHPRHYYDSPGVTGLDQMELHWSPNAVPMNEAGMRIALLDLLLSHWTVSFKDLEKSNKTMLQWTWIAYLWRVVNCSGIAATFIYLDFPACKQQCMLEVKAHVLAKSLEYVYRIHSTLLFLNSFWA